MNDNSSMGTCRRYSPAHALDEVIAGMGHTRESLAAIEDEDDEQLDA